MFLGQIDNYTVPTGEATQPIPIKTLTRTNDKIANTNGTLSFLKNGNYNVDASITVSSETAQDVIVSIYADGYERTSQTVTIPTSATTGESAYANVFLVDAIKVVLTSLNSIANIYFTVNQSGITVNGYIRVEYFK